IVLAIVTGRQARLTRQSIELANKEYISTNRPRLRVRSFRLEPLIPDKPITVRYEVVNVGGTRARIITHVITIRFPYTERRDQEAVEFSTAVGSIGEIAGGEALLSIKTLEINYLEEWQGFVDGAIQLFGQIAYMDDVGVVRR